MNVFEMEKEFNDLIKHGQELIEKLKQAQEPVKEATEEDIGKLCWFWDEENQPKRIEILKHFEPTLIQRRYCGVFGSAWNHCRRLTPAEVAEMTGYRVEE